MRVTLWGADLPDLEVEWESKLPEPGHLVRLVHPSSSNKPQWFAVGRIWHDLSHADPAHHITVRMRVELRAWRAAPEPRRGFLGNMRGVR